MNEILPADADRPRPGRQSAGTMGPRGDGQGIMPFSLSGPGGVSDGLILAAKRWDDDTAAAAERYSADFLIVVLAEPPAGPIEPPRSTVVVAPLRPTAMPADGAATAPSHLSPDATARWLTPEAMTALAEGALFACVPLTVAAGDIFTTTTYPFIDIARGGTIDGIIAGLNRIIAMTVPRDKQEGGTMVIPGHGRISDEAGVVEYRDMLTIVRDRIRDMIGKGMTLDQIRAAAPSSDYDGRYGSATGPWTTAMFVEAIYRTLEGASR